MRVEEIQSKKIIYACLNWGYGHVARSIGIVNQLIQQNNSIVFAGNKDQIKIFRTYFPTIESVVINGYPFHFSGQGTFAKDLWNAKGRLKNAMNEEKNWLERHLSDNQFDLVISDHRYGFYSDKIHSIFITHQLTLPIKKWQFIGQIIHKNFLKKFNDIWVMDYPDNRLAGKLSESIGLSEVYIGPFSRFMFQDAINDKDIPSILIVSGPKAYSKHLIETFKTYSFVIASEEIIDQFQLSNGVSNANWLACDEVIKRTKKIYSYCGYSTLLDREFIDSEYELIPTSGQPEQEYLSKFHRLLD